MASGWTIDGLEELMHPPANRASFELSQQHSNDGNQKDNQSKEKAMFQLATEVILTKHEVKSYPFSKLVPRLYFCRSQICFPLVICCGCYRKWNNKLIYHDLSIYSMVTFNSKRWVYQRVVLPYNPIFHHCLSHCYLPLNHHFQRLLTSMVTRNYKFETDPPPSNWPSRNSEFSHE